MYTQELGQIRVSCPHSAPKGTDTYLEILEGLLGRQVLAVGHHWGKDMDSGDHKEFVVVVVEVVLFFIVFF